MFISFLSIIHAKVYLIILLTKRIFLKNPTKSVFVKPIFLNRNYKCYRYCMFDNVV
jgi:hypothetical protein